MEQNEVIALMERIEKQNAQGKVDYWKTLGAALLDDKELGEKWCSFVDQQVNNDFTRGALLDETLQIMSLIKSNMPASLIAQVIKQIPSGQTILDSYLSAFIHPEILYNIQSHIDIKKL